MLLSYEPYAPDQIMPFEFTDDRAREHALDQVSIRHLAATATGQCFSSVHVEPASGQRDLTIVRLDSLWGNAATVDQKYIGYQYAAAFPEASYLSIDIPGHGDSDSATPEQLEVFKKSDGSFSKLSEAQVDAACNTIPDMKDVVLTGEGIGAPLALEFAVQAAARGITVRRLIGIDPLSLEDRSAFSLSALYHTKAQRSRRARETSTRITGAKRLDAAFNEDFVPRMQARGPIQRDGIPEYLRTIQREPAVLWAMIRKSPVTNGDGMKALEKALVLHPDMHVDLIFAGRSLVGRLSKSLEEKLADLHRRTDGRVEAHLAPYDNQNIGLAPHHPRHIQFMKDKLLT